MAGSRVAGKRTTRSGTKVKTGCATCRIRKVKCDESKPFCQKCVSTGRTCDGYESPFRLFASQPINSGPAGGIKGGAAGSQPIRSSLPEIGPEDIKLLNRYFSTKTLFDVSVSCDDEARQVLQASLTDPTVRHAVSSLRALREDLETSGEIPGAAVQQTPAHDYGLQQYCTALGSLASSLSVSGPKGLKSALLCCQVFISIEQVRGNHATMAQHITQGLRIMHEYRARPSFVAPNKFVPAHRDPLPFLDVFLIKLFAAPCKFSEPPAAADASQTMASMCVTSRQQLLGASGDFRAIVPNMRTELRRIATSALEFLDKVSHVASAENALALLAEKAALLDALESWLTDLERIETETRPPGPELISVSFMRLFHQTLKIVLLGALDASPDLDPELRTETDRLQGVASNVDERLKAYRAGSGT